MKVIVVPVADRPECKVALDATFGLAQRLSANIVGCHLRPHRVEATVPEKPRFRLRFGRSRPSDAATAKAGELKLKAAEKLFLQRVGEHDFELLKRPRLGFERGAIWNEMVGSLDRLFSIVGPVADMSVVSRPASDAGGLGPEFLLSALLHSGKPVLVLPQKPVRELANRILIAWDQSVDAARAVSAALPLLQQAEAVHVCSCGPENRTGPKSTSLARYLTFWGVKCTRSTTKGVDASQELEAEYRKTKSDLVVMGAYSRSRMSEVVFGGVTQRLLFETSAPVLALHS